MLLNRLVGFRLARQGVGRMMGRRSPSVSALSLLILISVLLATAACSGATPSVAPSAPATVEPELAATITPAPSAIPEPAPTAEPVARFEPGPCSFAMPAGAQVECGFVVVPEDREDPGGPSIRLARRHRAGSE